MKRSIVSACLSAVFPALPVMLGVALSAGGAPAPNTIPAVQEWTTGTGTMAFTTSSRIVVNTADAAALTADATTFAQDLNGLLGRAVTVATGASAGAGDVFLRLGTTDVTIGTEGYFMTITTYIDINARTAAGVFYGTRTLLQMLKASTTVNQGAIKDYPKGTWRGEMVDVGRKYYTFAWLQTLIRDMAYVKMNMFHFHLSDGLSATNNGGFRLQSTVHPEITSSQYYSTTQLQSLYANHRNLLLSSRVLDNQYWALDLSLDTVYSFVEEILEEFIPQFPGPFWHLGADEYMFISEYGNFSQLTTWARNHYGNSAHANDCYRHFTNWANEIVKAHGKTMWAWNDVLLGITGTHVGACTLATDIDMDHWGDLSWIGWGGVTPSAERALGYYMMNCSWDIFYVIGKSLGVGDPQWVYNNWELYTFGGGSLPAGDSHILGGKFPVWGDIPNAETEAQVWTHTFMLNRAIAQKVWASPKIQSTYSGFQSMASTIGRAPTPVVSVWETCAHYLRPSGRAESAQIFDLRGVLVRSVSGSALEAARVSRNAYRLADRGAGLTAGSYLCRFRGRGFERTEKILLVR
jgi:hexosaminidase